MTAAPTQAAGARFGATVTLLAMAAFFSGAALRMCDALIPRFVADFGVTPGVAGRVIISFAVAYGLMQIVFGPLADRFGKPQVMSFALVGCAVGAGASALASDFDWLVFLRIFWGMAAAGVIPLGMAWIGDMVPYEQRQATLARLLTGTLSGMMAGQLAGGLFADSAWGWRGAFWVATAGYVVVGFLLIAHLRRQPAPVRAQGSATGIGGMASNIGLVLGTPWARVVLVAVAAEGVFMLGPLAYVPAYLHERHAISVAAAASLAALYAVGGLLYAMTVRKVVARLGERRMCIWGGALMGAGFALWWLLPSWVLAGAVALMVGYGTYLFHNTLQTHATQMTPAVRGTSVALFAMCLFGGQAAGVSLAGFVVDRFGYVPMLLMAALTLPVAAWWFAAALRRRAN